MLTPAEQARLQGAHRLLAEKPSRVAHLDPAHQSLPEWVAAHWHRRAA